MTTLTAKHAFLAKACAVSELASLLRHKQGDRSE